MVIGKKIVDWFIIKIDRHRFAFLVSCKKNKKNSSKMFFVQEDTM